MSCKLHKNRRKRSRKHGNISNDFEWFSDESEIQLAKCRRRRPTAGGSDRRSTCVRSGPSPTERRVRSAKTGTGARSTSGCVGARPDPGGVRTWSGLRTCLLGGGSPCLAGGWSHPALTEARPRTAHAGPRAACTRPGVRPACTGPGPRSTCTKGRVY